MRPTGLVDEQEVDLRAEDGPDAVALLAGGGPSEDQRDAGLDVLALACTRGGRSSAICSSLVAASRTSLAKGPVRWWMAAVSAAAAAMRSARVPRPMARNSGRSRDHDRCVVAHHGLVHHGVEQLPLGRVVGVEGLDRHARPRATSRMPVPAHPLVVNNSVAVLMRFALVSAARLARSGES